MVKKLKITKPGFIINIPGIPEFRTPAKIDISKLDENLVRGELKKYDIESYSISQEDFKKKDIVKDEIVNPTKLINNYYTNDNSEELKGIIQKQQTSIENVENLLNNLLNNMKKNNPVEIKEVKKKDDFDDSVEDFIPEINLSSIKGNFKR